MKKIVILLGAVLAMSLTASAQERKTPEETTIIKAGMVAPQYTATMLDGTTLKSDDLRGKVVLLNFWATWCPPCRNEFTRVQKDIVDRYAGKDFVFIALSRGEEKQTVKDFMDKMGYTFPVGLDADQTVYRLFAENYIPRNFVIDKSGVVQMATIGYTPAEFEEMLEQIDGLLK